MVKIITENETLEVLEKHKEEYYMKGIYFVPKEKYKTLIKNPKMSDFEQGELPNCGILAAFAALYSRPEFFEEIYPKVVRINKSVKLQCKMFRNGEQVILRMNNTLPFYKGGSFLLYARSHRHSDLYLAAILEKAFVILACNYSYKGCIGLHPGFLFRSFSDSMIGERIWSKEQSKEDLMEYIKREYHNKSSVVLAVSQRFDLKPEQEDQRFHAFALRDYSEGFVKLYEPNCAPDWCISNVNLPSQLKNTADRDQGELWVTTEDFENRKVYVTSLYSKKLYRHVFKIVGQLKLSDKEKIISKAAFRVNVKKTTRFMINFFSTIFNKTDLEFEVTIADPYIQKIDLKLETDQGSYMNWNLNQKLNERQIWIKKFTLEPHTYNFCVHRKFVKENLTPEENTFLASQEEEHYHFRIASTSEFEFKEISYEHATSLIQEIEQKFEEMKLSNVGDDGNSNVNV